MNDHLRLIKRHPKNNDERTKLERSFAIALHVLETEHHVDIDNPENLSRYWPIYREHISADNGSLATSRWHAALKAKPLIPR